MGNEAVLVGVVILGTVVAIGGGGWLATIFRGKKAKSTPTKE